MDFQAQLIILMDIGIAVILGGIVGFEREDRDKPAGFRTNMIIAGASALLISLGRVIIVDFGMLQHADSYGIDPIRMLHAVIVGISVLGAGTILKTAEGGQVKYLTTAATIIMASAIGISVALKQYLLAVGTAVLVLLVNRVFRLVQRKLKHKNTHNDT